MQKDLVYVIDNERVEQVLVSIADLVLSDEITKANALKIVADLDTPDLDYKLYEHFLKILDEPFDYLEFGDDDNDEEMFYGEY